MRSVLVLLWLPFAFAVAYAEEPAPEARVFVEWQGPQSEVYVGEPFPVRLRLGIDEGYFEAHAVQLFKQSLQVPVQITAAWPGIPVESVRQVPSGPADARGSLALNGAVVQADRGGVEQRDGRGYRILTLHRTVRFEQAGAVALAAPSVRVAFANEFEEDFLGERVAIEPRFFTVTGLPVRLVVRPLPEEGRPALFSGAIGDYVIVKAGPDRMDLPVGETLTWTLRLSGFGNLARIEPPPLGALAGWDVRGARAEQIADGLVVERSFVYELAPKRAGVLTLPALPFSYFRPGDDAGYRVLQSKPLEITVEPAPGESVPAATGPGTRAAEGSEPVWLYGVFGAIVGALAVLLLGRRRRRADALPAQEAAADVARIEAARSALAERPDEAALAEFLAAQLGCSTAALIGPGLVARLQAAGVSAKLAQRTEETLEALVAARYGGAAASIDPALVAELQSALTT